MESTNAATYYKQAISHSGGLPVEMDAWPDDARRAYREVLRELDGWSRRNNASSVNNSWVAEEAIRQTW